MKIIDKLNQKGIHISFEVFPPKTDAGFDKVLSATDEIAKLNPSYISVTYGAGGGTSKNTAKIASHIKDDLGVMSLAHLTCASSTKEEVGEVIENLKAHGIENILALRGDIPEGMTFPDGDRFHYAYELVQEIKKHGDFCIGAACYPEGDVEQEHKEFPVQNQRSRNHSSGSAGNHADYQCCSDEAKPGTFRNSISEKISCNIRSLRKFSGGDEAGGNCLCDRSDY